MRAYSKKRKEKKSWPFCFISEQSRRYLRSRGRDSLLVLPYPEEERDPILDLRRLNRYICRLRFRMVTLASIISSFQTQDWIWLSSQDMYFHIAINLAHRKSLRFTVGPNHYQYKVLQFRLYMGSRISTEYLVDVGEDRIWEDKIHIYPYTWLIRSRSQQETATSLEYIHAHALSPFLRDLDLMVSFEKTLIPSQIIEFVGAMICSKPERAYLHKDKYLFLWGLLPR